MVSKFGRDAGDICEEQKDAKISGKYLKSGPGSAGDTVLELMIPCCFHRMWPFYQFYPKNIHFKI